MGVFVIKLETPTIDIRMHQTGHNRESVWHRLQRFEIRFALGNSLSRGEACGDFTLVMT